MMEIAGLGYVLTILSVLRILLFRVCDWAQKLVINRNNNMVKTLDNDLKVILLYQNSCFFWIIQSINDFFIVF